MFLILAALSFSVFVGNVFYGSVSGSSPLGNVGELLLLMLAAVSFVVAILQAEKRRDHGKSKP
ncbi:MAG: hypothetical protein KDJ67_03985 [Nitratireductor sp.]|nr:hypothetical protein [Nitratireductor sp.]